MLTLTLDLPPDISGDEVRLLLAIRLLEENRISAGKAAEIAGFTKPTFLEIASKRGVSVINYKHDELAGEQEL